MISLLKQLKGPWEKVRGYLLNDLEHLETAINQRWGQTFGDANLLQPGAIAGSSTPATRYVANTGVDNAPTWDRVDLTNGVKNTLPVANGGTGDTTLTAHGVLLGEGTSQIVATAVGATKTVLIGQTAADPLFSSAPEVLSMIVDQALTADSPTLVVDSTNHRVGMGTTAPTAALTISTNTTGALPTPLAGTVLHVGGADGASDRLMFDGFGLNGLLSFRRADGTLASPSAVQTDDILGALTFHGFGTAYTSARATIAATAAEVWDGTKQGTYISFSTTVKGGASNTAKVRIADTGNVGFQTTTPTAFVHMAAGGAAASTGPLKFTSGTLLTAPEAGLVEFVTDTYYATQTTGPTRKQIALVDAAAIGAAGEMATINTTGLTANVAAATLFVVPAGGEGLYRVSAYVVETVAGSVTSTLPNVQVVYTDKDSNTSVTLDVTPILGVAGIGQTGALTANTAGTVSTGVVPIYVKASTTIQYQTVNYASNLAGMTYALHVRLELM